MRYRDLKSSILAQFQSQESPGHRVVPLILGQPGGGKSACALDIAHTLVPDTTRHVVFNASLRDPVDILGTPSNRGDYTHWSPPEEFWHIRRGTGPAVLVLEELSDCPVPMQNALCSVIYDRRAGQLPLTETLYIIATGNRTEDKSGATRLTTKLANRCRILAFTEHIDDWETWAIAQELPAWLIRFLKFRPNLLAETFDANKSVNATPRSWERASYIPMTLFTQSESIYLEHLMGEVGEGPAVEALAFLKVYQNLPPIDDVLDAPDTFPVPTAPDVRYALCGALAVRVAKDPSRLPAMVAYSKRLPKEFAVMTMTEALQRNRKLNKMPGFSEFAAAHGDAFI
jgi:hypothetical protein